ncbi:MAG: tRNA (adenosine(37)-N6)-dimethylallyltransferase MiaA, partial [FCB group bacterium]
EGLFDDFIESKRVLTRKELQARFEKEGIEPLYEELKKVDLPSAEFYTDKNPRRILRALEFWYSAGKTLSESYKTKNTPKDFNILYFGIDLEREVLYERINQRSQKMWDSGLPQETERILNMGNSPTLNSLNTVGYKESIEYLNGTITKDTALDKIKLNTRHYAKRQMTWFRKNEKIVWLSGNSKEISGEIGKIHKENKMNKNLIEE